MAGALTRPAVVAVDESGLAGVLTYDIVATGCAILALCTVRRWAGAVAVAAVARLAAGLGCARYWVITINHKTDALRFTGAWGSGWRRCGVAPSMPCAGLLKKVRPFR